MAPYMLSWTVLARSSTAAFLAWPKGNQQLLDGRPLETGQLDPNGINGGWAPMTTDPPSVKHLTTRAEPRGLLSEGDLNGITETNTWLNSKTCGWFTGHPSSPFTCDDGWTCSTDTNHIVGCTTTNYFPSFAICYDYEAQRSGRCSSLGALTGCCSFSDYPACGTFLWVESTPRSMLRCMTSATIISINDHPQFVVDAAATTSSSQSTTTTGSDLVPLSTISDGAGSSGSAGGGGIHIGALIAAIGGVIAMIFVMLLVLFCVYRKRGPKDRHRQDRDDRPTISAPIPMTDLPPAAFAQQVRSPPRDPAADELVRESLGSDPYVWSKSRGRSPSLDRVPHAVLSDREA
ncbi:hypothetical protein MAPG_09615 [Magnaporthiopsis poae ATCC 64411]|uniref:Uncharacterized protein n=1 Tax=Magnaporthiopsis poae (strain ATCC 64411 / 73-15) TaxID=644358 RepID=A0A0C4EAE5_MAGP6|nr:hypothetical protein MAPG_09615 [Magnaporthiopsis poae ATCC 64411]